MAAWPGEPGLTPSLEVYDLTGAADQENLDAEGAVHVLEGVLLDTEVAVAAVGHARPPAHQGPWRALLALGNLVVGSMPAGLHTLNPDPWPGGQGILLVRSLLALGFDWTQNCRRQWQPMQ